MASEGGNMGHNEKVLEKINTMEQRANERNSLWKTVLDSFEKEGADGVATELARQMDAIEEKFDAALSKLDAML
jgi:predicted nucleotide-binding protein (sugar kinase/HSP70/actin superfamily)